ncbi:MAG TPA: diacylglycerol kinase family protein [Anaerolineae bacterium]|jgi:YegS/Rv2252/BmrU family lipid kinase
MYETLVIYNPKANRGRNLLIARELREYVDGLVESLADNNEHHKVDWVTTTHPGHATELAMQACQFNPDSTDLTQRKRVISMGGDGTLHEIINGLLKCPYENRPLLGIVPTGSGNDFVEGIGAVRDVHLAMRNIFSQNTPRSVDIGYLRIQGGEPHYWCNVVGIGFDAAVTLQSQRINWLRGQAMYFMAAVRTIIENYDAPNLEIDMDGVRTVQRVQMLTVGNGKREGGGFITTPAARVDDGLLDYALFHPVSRAMMVRLIPEVMAGTHGRFKQVQMGQLKKLTIHADSESRLLVHADGEMMVQNDADIHDIEVGVIPAAVRIISG